MKKYKTENLRGSSTKPAINDSLSGLLEEKIKYPLRIPAGIQRICPNKKVLSTRSMGSLYLSEKYI